MNLDIFKAYDVRGVYPAELDEADLQRRSAGRSWRISRPGASAWAATCGCRHRPGRGVHRGRARAGRRHRGLRDDRHRHAVLRRGHATASTAARRSPRRTIPKQYNGCKMVRQGQHSPERRRRHLGHPGHDRGEQDSAAGLRAGRHLVAGDILDGLREARDGLHRPIHHQAVQHRPGRRVRHGGPGGAGAVQGSCPARRRGCASTSTAPSPPTKPTR